MENKRNVGRPKKNKTITPGLRIDHATWVKFTEKHPKMANKMFNEWVKDMIKDT